MERKEPTLSLHPETTELKSRVRLTWGEVRALAEATPQEPTLVRPETVQAPRTEVRTDVRQEGEVVEAPEERVEVAQAPLVPAPKRQRHPPPVDRSRHEAGVAEPVRDVVVKVDLLHARA